MAKRLQHRGGTTSQHSSFTGAVREVTVDTDKNTLVVHDGALAGGHPLATATNFTSTGIDDNATSTAITIDSSQNVGIGDTTPSVKLDVNGAIGVGTSSAPTWNTGTFLWTEAGIGANIESYTLKFNTGATRNERMRIHPNGNVGIGTSSPATNLDINGSARVSTGSAYQFGGSDYKIEGSNVTSPRIGFITNSAERMRIDSSGNVGIGTSSPSSKLSIYSSDTTVYSASSVGGQDSGSTLKIQNNSNAADVFASIDFNTNNNRVVNRIVSSHGNSTVDGFLSFITEGGGTPAERMRINSSGNVGIGTSTPTEALEVKGRIILDGDGSGTNNGTLIIDGSATSSSQIRFSQDGTPKGYVTYWDSFDTLGLTDGSGNGLHFSPSTQRVGIGTSNPDCKLKVDAGTTASIFAPAMIITSSTGGAGGATPIDLRHSTNSSSGFRIQIAGSAGSNNATLNLIENSAMIFATNNAERMRILSTGQLIVGGTTTNSDIAGCRLHGSGIGAFTRDGNVSLLINRLTNDGNLAEIQQAGVTEGTISVSGTTVSYNGFTGSHWSRFIDESKPDVLRGTVMESLDQMTDWYHAEFETSYTEQDEDGNDVVKTIIEKKPYALKANDKEGDVITYAWEKKDEEGNDIIEQVQATIVKQLDVKHVMSKISDTVEAKNVYGVFSAWDNDDLINNDFYVASVGSFVVRIKAGQVVSKGDLLQSNGDGTAKVQADDIIRASTFAKVLSNTVIETYEDGSFIVPCSLMC